MYVYYVALNMFHQINIVVTVLIAAIKKIGASAY